MPGGEQRKPGGGNSCREPVECLERWQPQAKDARVAALQPSFLPQVERRHAAGDSEAGEARQHQGYVDGEQRA